MDIARSPAYRGELLRLGANGATRLGHMPGASLFVLASAVNVDYEQAIERCDDEPCREKDNMKPIISEELAVTGDVFKEIADWLAKYNP